jgi:phosphatidylethanolamine-binding protein (PEBP) family uncharacterized protein
MLKVSYGNTQVNEQRLEQSETIHQPNFCIKLKDNTYYTLIMFDPDAPSPDWLHYLIVNIKGMNKDELIEYSPPNPPSGTHRYIFLLCTQQDKLSLNKITQRENFNTKYFLTTNKLNIVDSTFFTVKK